LNATFKTGRRSRTSSNSSAPVCTTKASQNGPVMMSATVNVPENVYSRKLSPRQMRAGSHSPATMPAISRIVMARPFGPQSGQLAPARDTTVATKPAATTTQTKRRNSVDGRTTELPSSKDQDAARGWGAPARRGFDGPT